MHEKIIKRFGSRWRADNMPWVFKKTSRAELIKFWGELGFYKGVEVGTREGKFAMAMVRLIPNLQLICVDPYGKHLSSNKKKAERIYSLAKINLNKYDNIKLMHMTSMEAVGQFQDKSLDFVFIDGNHTFDYVCPDIIFWSKKVKSGGFVAVHDYYNSHWCGVVKAVDAYVHCHNINPWYVISSRMPTAFWVNP